MNNNFIIKNIPLKDLFLWDENARFPDKYFNKSDKDLIVYFLSKKDFKIRELANAVKEDFDLPQIEKFVVYEINGKLITLEGNRRLTVYKLLINPELTDDIKLQTFIKDLKSKIQIDDSFTIECLITQDREQGLRYIDRKHVNGNFEVSWGDTERAHHNFRRGKAKKKELFKIALSKIIKDLDIPETMKEKVLGPGFVTNFYRIIESDPAWNIFGFSLDDSGNLIVEDRDFLEKLKILIVNVLEKEDFSGNKIDSRSLNKNTEIEKYIRSIKKEDSNKVKEAIESGTQKTIFNEEVINIVKKETGKYSNPKSFARNYLIPKHCILLIDEIKINNIYRELRDDLLLDDSKKSVPNAVGVLFRVFLEISIDFFLEKEGITLKKETTLAGKITKMADHMETIKIAETRQLNNIRRVATDKNNILAINNFHDYVHSYKTQPSSSDLKLKWDNLQEFFEILWKYLSNKASSKNNKHVVKA